MNTDKILPLLSIRNTIALPGTTIPLVVGRPKSVAALKYAAEQAGQIIVTSQLNAAVDDPTSDQLRRMGTLCKIESLSGSEERGYQVVITCLNRFEIKEIFSEGDFFTGKGEIMPDRVGLDPVRRLALFSSLKDLARELLALIPNMDESLLRLIDKLDDPAQLTHLCATYLNIALEEKQKILETVLVEERIELVMKLMQKEREVLSVQKDIRERMTQRLTDAQRDSLLREQLRAIKEELGEDDDTVKDEIIGKLRDAELPPEVQKIADKEVERLENIPPASAEYHIIRNYLEWLADMPWNKSKSEEIDLIKAKEILDADHYGLEQVKKRIIQYLSVAKLKNNLRGPIFCLVGPPGVGKTSIGQSVARALGREFTRTSLGGVRDEAEIRGHRRTYVGAMPGRIIQSIKRVGVNNPVIMLDEIDKLGYSYSGDPASAMLELLDPEQNKAFYDHFLDVPFDLSNVFFITTANMVDTIPVALRDRLEIIELSSYTTNEKMHIARKHLIPKQQVEHGLKPDQLEVTDDALSEMVSGYTREAGVRELQRVMAQICRAAAVDIVAGKPIPIKIDSEKVQEVLGLRKFTDETSSSVSRPGVVTGMAWTPHGGTILFIEASIMPGTGQLKLTGQLGDVMKESAQIAMSLVRSELANITKYPFDKHDVHLHVPSGAIPKDGPSAGVALLTALTSLFSGIRVDPKIAMTGEISLRHAVMPVGGIKEKVLAAHRAGIREIFLPKRNMPDFSEVPEEVRNDLKVHFVEDVSEILDPLLGIKDFTYENAGSNVIALSQ